MKGIIFDLLQQVITDEHGDGIWDQLLDASGLDGVYTAVGSYDDAELFKLVETGSAMLGVKPDDLVRGFGSSCIPLLAQRYPSFFEQPDTKSFMLTLNDVIHPEVRKLFPGAYAPSFDFGDPSAETLMLTYSSHRNLCSFAEGLIVGAAAHFGQSVVIDQPHCTKRGDEQCQLAVSFKAIA